VDAVAAARRLLEGLVAFNASENLLARPFRVRTGIHTGRAAVDLARGVAYSPVLDVAGHLQKAAGANGLLVSEETWQVLPDQAAFVKLGVGTRDGIHAYGLVRAGDG
jgi:class 3 adenylate cyclase